MEIISKNKIKWSIVNRLDISGEPVFTVNNYQSKLFLLTYASILNTKFPGSIDIKNVKNVLSSDQQVKIQNGIFVNNPFHISAQVSKIYCERET